MTKKSKGFTLIELLVVIAIIGILATIVLVSLNSARSKARDSRRVSDLRQIALALEMYYDDNSTYPGTILQDGRAAAEWTSMVGAIQTGGQMTAVPNDPLGGSATYAYGGWNPAGVTPVNKYVLRAQLETCNSTSGVCATDVDGTIAGSCSCDDSGTNKYYCIQP